MSRKSSASTEKFGVVEVVLRTLNDNELLPCDKVALAIIAESL